MEHRRLGRVGRENSVLIFGGAALGEATEGAADTAMQQALDAGADHFDTAADYGDSELHYGRWMPEIRDRIFLSTKTGLREKDPARRQTAASPARPARGAGGPARGRCRRSGTASFSRPRRACARRIRRGARSSPPWSACAWTTWTSCSCTP